MKQFWKGSSKLFQGLVLGLALAICGTASAQLMYGNTVTVWTVNGPLTVTGPATFTAAQITGIISGSLPATGTVGEILESNKSFASATGVVSTVGTDVTSVTLTPGEWDISAVCQESFASVTATVKSCGYGFTSGTQLTSTGGSGMDTDPLVSTTETYGTTLTGLFSQDIGPVRFASSSSATIHLVLKDTFTSSSGTFTTWGTLRARRVN